MSIWHNEPIPTDKNKDVYVEFYTQIPYTDRETKSRCILLASDCEGVDEPDLIRWCYLDDLLAQQAEINKLREVIKKQDEFIEHMWINHPIVRGHVALLNKVHNARKALNGESGKK